MLNDGCRAEEQVLNLSVAPKPRSFPAGPFFLNHVLFRLTLAKFPWELLTPISVENLCPGPCCLLNLWIGECCHDGPGRPCVEEEGFLEEALEFMLERWVGVFQAALGGGLKQRATADKGMDI